MTPIRRPGSRSNSIQQKIQCPRIFPHFFSFQHALDVIFFFVTVQPRIVFTHLVSCDSQTTIEIILVPLISQGRILSCSTFIATVFQLKKIQGLFSVLKMDFHSFEPLTFLVSAIIDIFLLLISVLLRSLNSL